MAEILIGDILVGATDLDHAGEETIVYQFRAGALIDTLRHNLYINFLSNPPGVSSSFDRLGRLYVPVWADTVPVTGNEQPGIYRWNKNGTFDGRWGGPYILSLIHI